MTKPIILPQHAVVHSEGEVCLLAVGETASGAREAVDLPVRSGAEGCCGLRRRGAREKLRTDDLAPQGGRAVSQTVLPHLCEDRLPLVAGILPEKTSFHEFVIQGAS